MRKAVTNYRNFTLVMALSLLGAASVLAADEVPEPRTVSDPEIVIGELELLLKPLPKAQLLVEAEAWQALLQEKSEEIASLEVAIKRQNAQIEQAEETAGLSAEAAIDIDEAVKKAEEAARKGDAQAAEEARGAAEEARERVDELAEVAPGPAAGSEAARMLRSEQVSPEEKAEVLEAAAEEVSEEAEAKKEGKLTLLEQVTTLREERTALVDRLSAVLDELARKTDEGDSDTLAKIQDLRLYSEAVSGISVDVKDTTSAWVAIRGWLTSEEGGQRWAFNIGTFLAILFVAWMVSRLFSTGIRHALARIQGTSRLLENFLVRSVRWVVMAIGLIMALGALEISVGPLLAVVGAIGFVIAFALQDSLSNFASGLMILFFRPFDEGDAINAGGVSGKVQSMNLVSTTILTFDNQRMVVPNNKIWNDVITNITGVTERRVDMEFGIGYDDDIDRAQEILSEIIASHPKVLKDPEPTIRMHALADSSVNFIARPWAQTADYWDVYWDVTREVKKRFDAEGIGIPYPQRDVHLYIEGDAKLAAPVLSRAAAGRPGVAQTTRSDDGGLDDEEST